MKFAFAYCAVLTALFGWLSSGKPANAGLPIVQSAAPRHGFVCTTPLTPNLRPERKAGWA